jgi:hypothetical protein
VDVTDLLNHLLDDIDPGVVSQLDMVELRDVRDRCGAVEAGLSFGRRMVQGRLDIVMLERERRASGEDASSEQLMARLPEVLAQHTRGSGTPRPTRETDLPDFCDDISTALDQIVPASELASLDAATEERLTEVVDALVTFERQVSAKRQELHRVIDELQEEIVSRYRSGAASVDDLLR